MEEDEKSMIHAKRLALFSFRLRKLITKRGISSEKFAELVDIDGATMKTYTLTTPKEPSISNAIKIARELGVDLYYLLGLDWGEFIYPEPQTVSSLLVPVFRTLSIKGIKVNADFVSKEIIVSPTNQYFEEFFERVDVGEELESILPTFLPIILNVIKNEVNDQINSEEIYSTIVEGKSFKKISHLDEKIDPEFYFPILWDTILDTIPIDPVTRMSRKTPYPAITEDDIVDNFHHRFNAIADIAKKSGPSNKELAQRTHLSDPSINDYLSGTKLPRLNHFIDIACAFDVNPEYLLGLNDDGGKFPILVTLESQFLNLFKALKNANFKIRENNNHQKVAYSKNPYLYQFLDHRHEIKNINDAYKIIADKIASKNVRVMNGEILLYDDRIETDTIQNIRFHIENDLYNSNT